MLIFCLQAILIEWIRLNSTWQKTPSNERCQIEEEDLQELEGIGRGYLELSSNRERCYLRGQKTFAVSFAEWERFSDIAAGCGTAGKARSQLISLVVRQYIDNVKLGSFQSNIPRLQPETQTAGQAATFEREKAERILWIDGERTVINCLSLIMDNTPYKNGISNFSLQFFGLIHKDSFRRKIIYWRYCV